MNITHDICPNHSVLNQYYEQQQKEEEEFYSELGELIDIVKGLYYLNNKESELNTDSETDKENIAFERIALFFLNREREIKKEQFNQGYESGKKH